MVELVMLKKKDLGLNKQVWDALPTAVVGGAWEGSLQTLLTNADWWTVLNHIVPHGQQLKLLYLRVSTSDNNGAMFEIFQTNPTATGQTGAVEAFPAVGSVPSGVRDYPYLEAAGSEVLHGSLEAPIHVFEGSIDFMLLGLPATQPATANMYSLVWWGVEETPEQH